MRQYEKEDCIEEAKTGQNLRISWIYSNYVSITGGKDEVLIFKNPNTREPVFVPFDSKIAIGDKKYEIIKGKKYSEKRYTCEGENYKEHKHSTKCLLDNDGELHSLEDFLGKEILVLK